MLCFARHIHALPAATTASVFCGVVAFTMAVSFARAHPADGPAVTRVCAVAPDVLSITLQAGTYQANRLEPYVALAADEIVNENEKATFYTVKGGAIVEEHDRALY